MRSIFESLKVLNTSNYEFHQHIGREFEELKDLKGSLENMFDSVFNKNAELNQVKIQHTLKEKLTENCPGCILEKAGLKSNNINNNHHENIGVRQGLQKPPLAHNDVILEELDRSNSNTNNFVDESFGSIR